jgi:hypothetical protein
MGGTIDAIFSNGLSPLAPPQSPGIFPDASSGTTDNPLLLVTTVGNNQLFISTGIVGSIVVNGETFSDQGWGPAPLAIIYDLSTVLVGTNPLDGGEVYSTPASGIQSAVLAKLAQRDPSQGAAVWNLSKAFARLLTAAWA